MLAWAGATVRAARLAVTPLQVGASLRIADSLQDGRSRFYAGITPLRQIMDVASQPDGKRTLSFLGSHLAIIMRHEYSPTPQLIGNRHQVQVGVDMCSVSDQETIPS